MFRRSHSGNIRDKRTPILGVFSDPMKRKASIMLLTWHHTKYKAQDRIPDRFQCMDTRHRRYTPFRRQPHDTDNRSSGYHLPGFLLSTL